MYMFWYNLLIETAFSAGLMRLGTLCKQPCAGFGTHANLCTSAWPCIISVVNSDRITGKGSGYGMSWGISGISTKAFSVCELTESGLCGQYQKPIQEVNVRSASDSI